MNPLKIGLSGTHLIEASAGTGKTHTITTLYLRLLLEEGISVGNLLVVTYTNAATAELRDRIRRRLVNAHLACGRPDEVLPPSEPELRALLSQRIEQADQDRRRLNLALQSFDEAPILTIHGFCQGLLQDNAFETSSAFECELLSDESTLREELLNDFWVSKLHNADDLLLFQIAKEKLSPTTLLGLARQAMGNPDLRILPERSEIPCPDEHSSWEKAFNAVASTSKAERADAEDTLRTAPGLKRAQDKFSPTQIDEMIAGLDAELLLAEPGITIRFPNFFRLTPDGISEWTKLKGTPPIAPFFDACKELWDAELGWRQRSLTLQLDFASYIHNEAQRRKKLLNVFSFDDLLLRVRDALRSPAGARLAAIVRSRYAAALIDEFQDTDPVQYEIFDRIWRQGGSPLFLIGDPKQAIYGFRGADVVAYLTARDDADEQHNLEINWRSDPALIGALNYLYERTDDPFGGVQIKHRAVTSAPGRTNCLQGVPDVAASLRLLFLGGESVKGARGRITAEKSKQFLPDAVAGEIVHLLHSGATIDTDSGPHPVGPGDIAVLCRKNEQARNIHKSLGQCGVPAILQGDQSVFESEEAKEIATVLTAISESAEPHRLGAALATTMLGRTADELVALFENDDGFDEICSRFSVWKSLWNTRSFMHAFHRMVSDEGVVERLLATSRGERRLTNMFHVAELLHRVTIAEHLGPRELLEWLRRRIETGQTTGELSLDEAQIRIESDAKAVTVTTIHKSKGLEWPIVFCPYLWSPSGLGRNTMVRFHDDDRRIAIDLGSANYEKHRKSAETEILSEDLRLLYVALTRARHQVNVVWGAFSNADKSPLARFLGDAASSSDDSTILESLHSLATAGPSGAIAVRELKLATQTTWSTTKTPLASLNIRTFPRVLEETWRNSSFTSLVARGIKLGGEAEEGADRDELAATANLEAPSEFEEQNLPLASFPAGAQVGILLHEILEQIDFQRLDQAELRIVVEEHLLTGGINLQWASRLEMAIADLLTAPLDAGGTPIRLADIGNAQRRSEMEFTLPMGLEKPLTAARLAEVFSARHPELPDGYPERVSRLDFPDLEGFLRGSIDLVFRHQGQFWLLDWKSNHLGSTRMNYTRTALTTEMATHHYFLQYHIYVTALHRHLKTRIADYNYERDFGGVLYLFLRGITASGGASGVFFDRPSQSSIERLSALAGELYS